MKYLSLLLLCFLPTFSNADETGGKNIVRNGNLNSNSTWKYIDARRQKDDKGNLFIQLNYAKKFLYKNGTQGLKDKSGTRNKNFTSASQKIHFKSNYEYKLSFKARGQLKGTNKGRKGIKSQPAINDSAGVGLAQNSSPDRGAVKGLLNLQKKIDDDYMKSLKSSKKDKTKTKKTKNKNTKDWQTFTVKFTTSYPHKHNYLVFFSNANNAFQIDDITLIEIGPSKKAEKKNKKK